MQIEAIGAEQFDELSVGRGGEFLTLQESHYALVMFNSLLGLKGYQ
jgi:hypothetical protein